MENTVNYTIDVELTKYRSLDVGYPRQVKAQLASAGHKVEYAGYKKGDFRIDGNIVIEVGGQEKGFSQVAGQENAYVAADNIESANTAQPTNPVGKGGTAVNPRL